MFRVNFNVSLGNVDCSLYTRRTALEKENHEKRMDMLAYIFVKFSHTETLTKTFIISARKNQFVQENIFYNAPVRRSHLALITNSSVTATYTENLFWYQQFDLRYNRKLRGGEPNIDFEVVDKGRFYVTTMKTLNFQDEILSIPNDNSKTPTVY